MNAQALPSSSPPEPFSPALRLARSVDSRPNRALCAGSARGPAMRKQLHQIVSHGDEEEHAEGDVVVRRTLDPSRRRQAQAVAVDEQLTVIAGWYSARPRSSPVWQAA